jgi:hypothetical protein
MRQEKGINRYNQQSFSVLKVFIKTDFICLMKTEDIFYRLRSKQGMKPAEMESVYYISKYLALQERKQNGKKEREEKAEIHVRFSKAISFF